MLSLKNKFEGILQQQSAPYVRFLSNQTSLIQSSIISTQYDHLPSWPFSVTLYVKMSPCEIPET